MAWTPSTGDTIAGQYQITSPIGEGGFAVVWHAEDSRTGEDVAIKHPNLNSNNQDSVVKEYFDQELETLRKIDASGNHPNIVDLIAEPVEQGLQCLVVDLIRGKELKDKIESEGPISDPDEVRRIGIDICDAMAYLHENEILYRDLKPDNVMLSQNDRPVLIDFNTAKVWDPDSAGMKCPQCGDSVSPSEVQCSSCGTSLIDTEFGGDPFKPVEIAEARRYPEMEQGPWSDVYSIGKSLMYMLAGTAPPKDGVDPRDFGVSCPDYLAEIVERSTRRDYEKRYRNATVLKYVLENRDATPPTIATVTWMQTGQSYKIHPGDTIGRRGADGPAPSIAIDDPQDNYISAVQVQFDVDSAGRWILKDKSLNGTYVQKGNGWQKVLCEEGRDRLQRKGHDPTDRNGNIPPETLRIDPGDIITLVNPSYDVTFKFETTL